MTKRHRNAIYGALIPVAVGTSLAVGAVIEFARAHRRANARKGGRA